MVIPKPVETDATCSTKTIFSSNKSIAVLTIEIFGVLIIKLRVDAVSVFRSISYLNEFNETILLYICEIIKAYRFQRIIRISEYKLNSWSLRIVSYTKGAASILFSTTSTVMAISSAAVFVRRQKASGFKLS